jgi:serine/threonine protein kinase
MFCPDCGTWNRGSAVICARCSHELPELSDAPADKPDEEMDLLRRAAGGRYRIFRRLATGGMASVYAAKHVQLGRQLVVKVLLGHLARDPEMRERFKREAEASAQLFHPHICSILDYGELETTVYLVMPYMAGGSLADLIVRGGTVPPSVAASVCAQVSIALDYAHRHGIVHRDVKPDNILFDEDGNALITDFGIATARFHQRLTMTGRAMGTPHYMSPEQAMGKLVDGRSDIYAIGILLYESLTGVPPFDGADAFAVSYKQVHEAPATPAQVNSRIPIGLSDVAMRCLAKSPAARYARGYEVADALIAFLRTAPDSASAVRNASAARRSSVPTRT